MKMSLALSDGLFELRRKLAGWDQNEGRYLTVDEVRGLLTELKELGMKARRMENDQSRLLWNEEAQKDLKRLMAQGDIVVAAAARPGSNVRLFPPPERPFGDGVRR